MLTSLFGDLGVARDRIVEPIAGDDQPDAGFAATAIMESVATFIAWSTLISSRSCAPNKLPIALEVASSMTKSASALTISFAVMTPTSDPERTSWSTLVL